MKIHIVKKGDTLFKLSQKYQVPLQKLIDINPQISNPDQLSIGMKVKIPSEAVAVANHYSIIHKHVVKQGDTLWKLSKAWGVSLKDMINANPQLKNPNALLDGEVVNIPNVHHSQSTMNVDDNVHGYSQDQVQTGKKYTGPKEEMTKPIEPMTELQLPNLPNVQAPMKPIFPEIEFYKETTNVYVLPVETKTEPTFVKEEPSHDLFAQYSAPAHEVISPYKYENIENIENISNVNMPKEHMSYPGAPSMMSYPCPPSYPVQHIMANEPNVPYEHNPYYNVAHVYESGEYTSHPGKADHVYEGSSDYPFGVNPSYYGASNHGVPNIYGGTHDMHMHGYGAVPYAGAENVPYEMHYAHVATHYGMPQPSLMMPQYAANQPMSYIPYGVQDDCGCGGREQGPIQVQNAFVETVAEDPSRYIDGTGAEASTQSVSEAQTEPVSEQEKQVNILNTIKNKNAKSSSPSSRNKTQKKDRRSKTKTGRHNPWLKN
ncbi:LysM peptidoglycan-binding domain-containing protein [Paenibacillus sediminis]|uniref:Morphogenetic protein associated with SpoVID n=1 Tax=Paenibacillus sediminis TaxID=664909 RepID=A0ABS4H730_9BACL|nr:morphogenetic protein associated with SpoVID [Paenibacillus sediminis]